MQLCQNKLTQLIDPKDRGDHILEDAIIKYKYFRPRLFDDEMREENVLSSHWRKGLRTKNLSQANQVLCNASVGSPSDLGQAPLRALFTRCFLCLRVDFYKVFILLRWKIQTMLLKWNVWVTSLRIGGQSPQSGHTNYLYLGSRGDRFPNTVSTRDRVTWATCFPTLLCEKRKEKKGTWWCAWSGETHTRPNPTRDFSPERMSIAQGLLPAKECLQVNLHLLIITRQSHIFKGLGSECVRQHLNHRRLLGVWRKKEAPDVAGRLAGQQRVC